jgi:hypothetical protein
MSTSISRRWMRAYSLAFFCRSKSIEVGSIMKLYFSFDFCRRLRQAGLRQTIIMLTVQREEVVT